MFHSPQSDHYRPPSALASGRFLTLLAIQLIAICVGLFLSHNLYSVFESLVQQHESFQDQRNHVEIVSDRLSRVLFATNASSPLILESPNNVVEINFLTGSVEQILKQHNSIQDAKNTIREQLLLVNTLRQQKLNYSNKLALNTALANLNDALRAYRAALNRQDAETFQHLYDIRSASFWNNLCEAFAFVLMFVTVIWAINLYRLLRKQEIARFRIESELSAERRALEQRVRVRTAALENEVKERQRVENLNHGRSQILEMLAQNESYDEILQALAQTLSEYYSTWACAIHTLDTGKLKLVASAKLSEKVKSHLSTIPITLAAAPEIIAMATRKPYLVEDLAAERKTWSELLLANGLMSVWSAPFFSPDNCTLGTLTIYTLLKWQPTANDIEMLDGGCNMASLVLERTRMQTQLMDHAYHDSLTGLPNRRLGRDRLFNATCRAGRSGKGIAVLWIDLNRFKAINDRYGHPVGDAVLQKTAQRLTGRLRSSDTLARMGGDEFMAIMEEVGDRAEASYIAEELLNLLRQPMQIGELQLDVSASIGVSIYPEDGDTVDSLAQHADQAMYVAKFGNCGVVAFAPDMDRVPAERRMLEEEMAAALQSGGFKVVYQPYCLPDGTLIGFEALLRFESPRLGLVMPTQFIPIAEQSQLIIPIGEWVLREVCKLSSAWKAAGLNEHSIAVNISALQFSRDDFSGKVSEILEETGASGANIVLELTESIVMNDFTESARQMKRLKKLGVRIAVDDFGTGYSSLSYLHRLPIDVLKIDRSFMETLNEADGTRPIVEAVLSMARTLGLRVVAEGVETTSQLNTLRQIGCHVIQGYLFSKPVEQSLAEAALKRGWLDGGQRKQMPMMRSLQVVEAVAAKIDSISTCDSVREGQLDTDQDLNLEENQPA